MIDPQKETLGLEVGDVRLQVEPRLAAESPFRRCRNIVHQRSSPCCGPNTAWIATASHRLLVIDQFKAQRAGKCGRFPLPKGEGWGEGLQNIERSDPPHPNPLPVGERESRRAIVESVP